MSLAQGRHLAALSEHHLKSLLGRQRRQIVQLELDFRTFVASACFQDRHGLHLDREHNIAATRPLYSTVFSQTKQGPCQGSQEADHVLTVVSAIDKALCVTFGLRHTALRYYDLNALT